VAEQRDKSKEQLKKEFAEQSWLTFFNQMLYMQGIITEAERNKMQNLINSRKPSPPSAPKL
jgi:hypothetical protein